MTPRRHGRRARGDRVDPSSARDRQADAAVMQCRGDCRDKYWISDLISTRGPLADPDGHPLRSTVGTGKRQDTGGRRHEY